MGFWGYKLYSNDITSDVRDVYKDFLNGCDNNEQAYNKVCEFFCDYINTDEEPLFWYAIADIQWSKGILTSNVKQKALYWIEQDAGVSLFEENEKHKIKWLETLADLKEKLNSPMPEKKKNNKKTWFRNPWNVGDLYAYRFSSEKAKECGTFGKYIVFHKISDQETPPYYVFSRVQIFDKLFDDVPKAEDIREARILPLDNPERLAIKDRHDEDPIVLNSVMVYINQKDYPYKNFVFVDNIPDVYNWPRSNKFSAYLDWFNIEDALCESLVLWKDYQYEYNCDSLRISKK